MTTTGRRSSGASTSRCRAGASPLARAPPSWSSSSPPDTAPRSRSRRTAGRARWRSSSAASASRAGGHRAGQHVLRHRGGGDPRRRTCPLRRRRRRPRSPSSPATSRPRSRPTPSASCIVHIGGLVTPARSAAIADLCRAPRSVAASRTPPTPTASSYAGRAAGSFGDAGAFSFYPTKVITSGEGGMIVTADEQIRDEARIYRDQGKAGFLGGDHVRLGYAWRHERGPRRRRRGAARPGSTSSSSAARDRRRSTTSGWPASPASPLGRPADVRVQLLQVHRPARRRHRPRPSSRRRCARTTASALTGEVYAKPLHRQPVFADLPAGPLPGRRGRLRPARLPAGPLRHDRGGGHVRRLQCHRSARRPMAEALRIAVTGGPGSSARTSSTRSSTAGPQRRRPRHPSRSTGRTSASPGSTSATVDASTAAFEDVDVVFHLAAVSNVNDAYADPFGRDRRSTSSAPPTSGRRPGATASGGRCWPARSGSTRAPTATGPLDEDTPFHLPSAGHLYTSSKIAAEMVVHSYAELYGQPFTILRYGIPYGPRMRDELVIPQFCPQGARGRADHHPRRRQPVPQLRLRRGPGRRPRAGARPDAENEVFNLEGTEPVSVARARRDRPFDHRRAGRDRTRSRRGPATTPARPSRPPRPSGCWAGPRRPRSRTGCGLTFESLHGGPRQADRRHGQQVTAGRRPAIAPAVEVGCRSVRRRRRRAHAAERADPRAVGTGAGHAPRRMHLAWPRTGHRSP